MNARVTGVAALLEKYRELKALRDQAASSNDAAPRARLVALARRFPGALRELDQLSMPEIERRIIALDALVASAEAPPEWVRLQLAYHGLLRVALRIKRMGRGVTEDRVGAILVELADRYRPDPDEPSAQFLDRGVVAAIVKPHAGRLNPWVFAQVAARCSVSVAEVQRALFGEDVA